MSSSRFQFGVTLIMATINSCFTAISRSGGRSERRTDRQTDTFHLAGRCFSFSFSSSFSSSSTSSIWVCNLITNSNALHQLPTKAAIHRQHHSATQPARTPSLPLPSFLTLCRPSLGGVRMANVSDHVVTQLCAMCAERSILFSTTHRNPHESHLNRSSLKGPLKSVEIGRCAAQWLAATDQVT